MTQQAILDELDGLEEAEVREVLIFAASLKSKRAIQKTVGVNGGAANIGATRIAVWMIEAARREGLGDEEILEMYPNLNAADLAGAWSYVRLHEAEIEREIAGNEAA